MFTPFLKSLMSLLALLLYQDYSYRPCICRDILNSFWACYFRAGASAAPLGGSFVAKKNTLKGVNSVVLRVILSNFLLLFSVAGQYMQDKLLNYCAHSLYIKETYCGSLVCF